MADRRISKHTKHFIMPLTKCPFAPGRKGPLHLHDWYRALQKSVALANRIIAKGGDATIILVSDFCLKGFGKEVDMYRTELERMGFDVVRKVHEINEGFETLTQLDAAIRHAEAHQAELTVVSVFMHNLRARQLTFGKKISHHCSLGIPIPKSFVMDFILLFVYPAIRMAGLRDRFLDRVRERRRQGII